MKSMNSLTQHDDDLSAEDLRRLLVGMRSAFEQGNNAMEFARAALGKTSNLTIATLIAYDLQAGAYVNQALSNPAEKQLWCEQLASLVSRHLSPGGSLLEVGSGEATTLAGVLEALPAPPTVALGFDISWSRCAHGNGWLKHKHQQAELFVADLFNIPLADESVDVVYSSHSLEPNGGRETAALSELLRVAKRAVVLVEPIYELADADARARMSHHGYVRDLKATAERLGCNVTDYRLLDFYVNPLNPSGVVCLEKSQARSVTTPAWRCPLTQTPLTRTTDAFSSAETGLVYPVLSGIPLLCRDHAVLASSFGKPITS
ncbi:class I SAM-dependent methyltransferase [Denitromonas ohlonensis]|nr:class I SAM-dependent methyltransferase [Denitromonas ohlonensis]